MVSFTVSDNANVSANAGPLSININLPPDPLDNWHLRYSLPQGQIFRDVTSSQDVFVAVGDSGTIATSSDGTTWAPQMSGVDLDLLKVTFGNGIFVTLGHKYLDFAHSVYMILISPDGITWTSQALQYSISGITFGNGIFVATGNSSYPDFHGIMTSTDCINWTVRTSTSAAPIDALSYGNGMFVAVIDGMIWTSADGASWTSISSGIPEYLTAVTYGNGIFIAVGNSGGIYASDDGVTWRTLPPAAASLRAVTYRSGIFLTVGFGAPSAPDTLTPGVMMTSSDGVTWTSRNTGAGVLNGVTFGKGTFVAVGGNEIIQSDPMQ